MKILRDGEYYGQKKRELHINGIILSEYSYETQCTDWHYHENPYFMYLLDGCVWDINKKRTHRCNPGTLLFHNWQDQHCNSKHSKSARGFHIEFNNNWLKDTKVGTIKSMGSLLINHPEAHFILGKIYREFYLKDSFSSSGIEALLVALCLSTESDSNVSDRKPSWLMSLIDLVYEGEQVYSLNELSTILGVHPVHISRTFSKQLGCTLSEFIRMIKIRKSLSLLFEGRHNLTEISYLCGFSDQGHFTRTFKTYFGMSPRNYKTGIKLKC